MRDAYRNVWIKVLPCNEKFDNGQMIVRDSPMNRQASVLIWLRRKSSVGLDMLERMDGGLTGHHLH